MGIMSSDLLPSGESLSQGDLEGDAPRFDPGVIIQWKLRKEDMVKKRPRVTKPIRMRNRVYCDSCKIPTGRKGSKCVKCGGGPFSTRVDEEEMLLMVANAGDGLEEALVYHGGRGMELRMDVNAQTMAIQLSYGL